MLYKIIQDEINVNNIMQEYYTNLINRLPKGSIIVKKRIIINIYIYIIKKIIKLKMNIMETILNIMNY